MPFKVNGIELPDAEHIRIYEMVEAEKSLDIKFDETGMAGQVAVLMFVAMRRKDKERPAALLADEVMKVDIASIEEVKEGPPALKPVADDGDTERQPTTGAPLSEASA